MALAPGDHALTPADGRLTVLTRRDGAAQRVGHDLEIEVRDWRGAVSVGPDARVTRVEFHADPGSLYVRAGHGGLKPLSDSDRREIHLNITSKVLGRRRIAYLAEDLAPAPQSLSVRGELTIGGVTRPLAVRVALATDGCAEAAFTLRQSDWGVKPYSALLGALRVRDEVECRLTARLPTA